MKVTLELTDAEVAAIEDISPGCSTYLPSTLKKLQDVVVAKQDLARHEAERGSTLRTKNPALKTNKALNKALQTEYDKNRSLINCILMCRANRDLGLSEAKDYCDKVIRR